MTYLHRSIYYSMVLFCIIFVYNALFVALLPAQVLLFAKRIYKNKDNGSSIKQRFVISYIFSKKKQYDIWLHAASVGEIKSMDFIIKKHLELGHKILITTGTITSKQIITHYNNPNITHRFTPLDFIPFILFFLYKHKVHNIIITESEIWPSMFYTFMLLKMNITLLNADISLKSQRRWNKCRFALSGLLSACKIITTQNQVTAIFLQKFHNNTHYLGNMKLLNLDSKYKPQNNTIINFCQSNLPIITIASTHHGEDESIIQAIAEYRTKYKFVYVPRHFDRASDITKFFNKYNITYSALSVYQKDKECLLIDSIGNLIDALYFSKIAIYGGSFLPHLSGHNVLEAGIFKTSIIIGPFVETFQEIITELKELNAIIQTDLENISNAITAAESNSEMGEKVYNYIHDHKPDLDKIYSILGL